MKKITFLFTILSISTLSAQNFLFTTNGNAEGWVNQSAITSSTVSGGVLGVTPSGGNFPSLRNTLSTIDATSYKYLAVKVRNQSNYNQIRFRATDDGGTTFVATVAQSINENESAAAPFTEYIIDLNSLTTWNTNNELNYEVRFSRNPTGGTNSNLIEIDEIRFLTSLNVNSQSITVFKAYPNPVVDNLIIQTDLNVEKCEVYNVNGQLVKTISNVVENTITLNELNLGMYFIKVTSENDTQTLKVLKQ